MSKYIDVERYINNLRELRTGDKDTVYEYYDDGIDVAISEAAIFPAADVVEVVRCKDCKYAHMTMDGECKYCDIWFPDEKEYMDGDYYCASGDRKDG